MKYLDGQLAQIGDVVDLGAGWIGTVVADLDGGEYSAEFPASEWSYLERGILVTCKEAGLIHFAKPEVDLTLLRRRAP